MQQKPHCIKRQYRCEHEQDHCEETAQVAFMLPRRPQRCTMQPQVTADGIDKDEEQDWRIREERHDLECRQYRIAHEEQGQERLILAFRQVRKEQILKRDEQREYNIAGNEPVAAKQDGQRCANDVREFMRQEIRPIYHRFDAPSIEEHRHQQQDELLPVHRAIHHEITRDQDKDCIAHIAAPIDELRKSKLPGKHIRMKDTLRRFQHMKYTMHAKVVGNDDQHGDNPQ